jgi:hypothetical protein
MSESDMDLVSSSNHNRMSKKNNCRIKYMYKNLWQENILIKARGNRFPTGLCKCNV